MTAIDKAKEVREGDELDVTALDNYLKKNIPGLEGELIVKQFPGGASNLTYLLGYSNKELVLRRPPRGKIAKSAHDMLREAGIMQALKPHYSAVPEVLACCDNRQVLGCDFFVMERLLGIIPRKNFPKELTLNKEQTHQLCLAFVDKLVELHRIDYNSAGMNQLGKGRGYVQRQVDGWSDRYHKAKTEDAADFEVVMSWLKANQPEDVATCLIHNDYRFDNVVLYPDSPYRIIGVLDWEMATLGDPLMDLGNSLAYWVESGDDDVFQLMRMQPSHLPGMLSRQQLVDYYRQHCGFEFGHFDYYEVFGLFRLAVIIQQIYQRYLTGHSKDERFAMFGEAAKYLEQRCLGLIDQFEGG